jgi:hypothetical protein
MTGQTLKLYIWRDAFSHVWYGGGIAFSLAEDPEQARKLILADAEYGYRKPNLSDEPLTYSCPMGDAYSWEV